MNQQVNQIKVNYSKLKSLIDELPIILTLEECKFPDKKSMLGAKIGEVTSLVLSMKEDTKELPEEKYRVHVDFLKLHSAAVVAQEYIRTENWIELYVKVEKELLPLVKMDSEDAIENVSRKQPFIEDLWEKGLVFLEKFTLFYLMRTVIPDLKVAGHPLFPRLKKYFSGNYFFVDFWVLMNTILSIVSVFIMSASSVPLWMKYALIIYGFTRVFEIFIYQMNVIFVHPYRNKGKRYYLRGYRRMTILLLHNFAEIIFWFAGTYLVTKMLVDENPVIAISQSFIQMLTYSFSLSDDKLPLLALFIMQAQAVIGVFMTILTLARFTSLFPKPETLDARERGLIDVSDATAEIKTTAHTEKQIQNS